MAIIRANANSYESGELYASQLQNEVNKNFNILLALLSSYWKSTVDGPYYARSLKAIAIALSQVRISLDSIYNDAEYSQTRGEFLNQVVTNLVFPDDQVDLGYSDVDFREFLTKIIAVYFKGSIPSSIEEAVSLITGTDVQLFINYEEARKPGSGFDISDQFGFNVDIILNDPSQINVFLADPNIRILLQIIRPAHTLYTLRYILREEYLGNLALPYVGPRPPPKVTDSLIMDISDYKYADYRKFVLGVSGVDEDGFKPSYSVSMEDHSLDF